MRLLVVLAFLMLQILTSATSLANFAAWDKPTINNEEPIQWLVKESKHFTITYPEANTVMADKALNIAERVHAELVPFFVGLAFNHSYSKQSSAILSSSIEPPQHKTKMVLVDDFDVSNGWATFYPFAQIRLFSSPPDSVGGLEVNDDWLHTLIRHEYVHILQLEMARGAPEFLRHVFGRVPLFFPHTITPSFLLEGLATYLETNNELGYGRLQGSYYSMQMRTEVAEQRLKSLGDVAAPLRDLPLGMQYLYGSYFFKYLTETYGEQAIQQYLFQYSGQFLPAIMLNSTLENVIHKDFDDVWLDYQVWLGEQFKQQIEDLETSDLQGESLVSLPNYNHVFNRESSSSHDPESTKHKQLDQGLFKDAVSSNGSDFYYIHNNGEDTPELRSYSLTEKEDNAVRVETDNVIALDVNDQKEIVISRMITWADGRSWADLFLLEEGLLGKKWKAITLKSRLRNVRWLNNDIMVASRKVHGISELVMLDKQGHMFSLWSGEDETTVIGDFDVAYHLDDSSAESVYIVAAMKRAGQGWNLERLDLNEDYSINLTKNTQMQNILIENSWQLITDTKAIENSPQILTNGRILFSADYDGIYNLYTLNPNTQKLTQLTRMLTGAFEPKLINSSGKSSENVIVFQAYTADGFEFRQIALSNYNKEKHDKTENSETERSVFHVSEKQGRYDYPAPFTLEVEKTVVESYSSSSIFSSLAPRWWLPYYSVTPEATQVGITTGGTDTLSRHNYELSVGVDWQNELADMRFYYGYDNRYQVSFQRTHEYVDVIEGSQPEFIIEQDRWVLARHHIANALEDQLSLHAGIVVEREGTVDREDLFSLGCRDGLGALHKTCEKTLTGIALKFDNRKAYLNSPGFSTGRYVDLVYEHNEVLSGVFDSDYQGAILQGQWKEVFDLPGRRSLSLQVIAAQADKKSERMTLGGDNLWTELSLFGRDDFSLRGYGSTVQLGNNLNINRVNYTQWLARIDKGWGIWPIGAGDISADMYVDYGSAWDDRNEPSYLAGVGIDFKIEILAFYNLMMPLKLSFARGLDKDLGENRVGLGVSLPY